MTLPSHKLILLIFVAAFTLLTAWTDLRQRKIFNWATLPMWLLGWLYQIGWFGWPGLLNGGLGCGTGFGLFFLLWTLKIAGGGDVKLMAALGVWLGFQRTTHVIFASLAVVLAWHLLQKANSAASSPTLVSDTAAAERPVSPAAAGQATVRRKRDRARVQAFAPAVAVGTWLVLLTGWQQW
ncbi:MAG: A24 family peptidase [Planctomycetaceae bacterium]|nr:A24 family peptidase [Planctomycetaceae bacterium]